MNRFHKEMIRMYGTKVWRLTIFEFIICWVLMIYMMPFINLFEDECEKEWKRLADKGILTPKGELKWD